MVSELTKIDNIEKDENLCVYILISSIIPRFIIFYYFIWYSKLIFRWKIPETLISNSPVWDKHDIWQDLTFFLLSWKKQNFIIPIIRIISCVTCKNFFFMFNLLIYYLWDIQRTDINEINFVRLKDNIFNKY